MKKRLRKKLFKGEYYDPKIRSKSALMFRPLMQELETVLLANAILQDSQPLTGAAYDVLSDFAHREALKEPNIAGML